MAGVIDQPARGVTPMPPLATGTKSVREPIFTSSPLALVDRDGTINVDPGYLRDPNTVALLNGAAEGLRRLTGLGYVLAIVTNQSGIARGLMTADDVAQVNARLVELLASEGVPIAAVATCPHGPADACGCRKPQPGLAHEVARLTGRSLDGVIVIGDKASDVGLAKAIGARAILIAPRAASPPDFGQDGTAADLVAAAVIAAEWMAETQAAAEGCRSSTAR